MLIPPSHNMVLFALAAGNVSIARLFMAGVLPGFTLALVLCIYCYIVAVKRNYPKGEGFKLSLAIKAFIKALPGLGTVMIVVVGVLGGIFTATEAAAFAVAYSLIVGIFVYREIAIKDVPKIFAKALKTSAIILILIGLTNCFSWLVTYMNVATYVTELIMSITSNKIIILLMIQSVFDPVRHGYGYVGDHPDRYTDPSSHHHKPWHGSLSVLCNADLKPWHRCNHTAGWKYPVYRKCSIWPQCWSAFQGYDSVLHGYGRSTALRNLYPGVVYISSQSAGNLIKL